MPINGVFHIQFVGDDREVIDRLAQLGQSAMPSTIELHALPDIGTHMANTNIHYRNKRLDCPSDGWTRP